MLLQSTTSTCAGVALFDDDVFTVCLQQMDKALELKENRLHTLYTRVNTTHTTGAELRVKINNLRREKLAFECTHRRVRRLTCVVLLRPPSKLERAVCESKATLVWLIQQHAKECEAHIMVRFVVCSLCVLHGVCVGV